MNPAITPAAARNWSRLGPRAVFGAALLEAAAQNENILAASADLLISSGLDRFRKTFPDRALNFGIAEQNLVGAAAGLAREGFRVFISTFAPFLSLRAAEQIRLNLGYMGADVKAVALGGGLGMGPLGNSHYGLEDLAVMRAIPGLTVVGPADGAEIFKTVLAAAADPRPMYIRLTGGLPLPVVYQEDYDFVLGRAVTLRPGSSGAIIANGSLVAPALEAAELLKEKGFEPAVINMHTIKPLDTEILETLREAEFLVTAEEHSRVGGLGAAVAEHLAGFKKKPPQLILGLPDAFGPVGEYPYLMGKYGLTGPGLAASVSRFIDSLGA